MELPKRCYEEGATKPFRAKLQRTVFGPYPTSSNSSLILLSSKVVCSLVHALSSQIIMRLGVRWKKKGIFFHHVSLLLKLSLFKHTIFNPYPTCWTCDAKFGVLACAKCRVSSFVVAYQERLPSTAAKCQRTDWHQHKRLFQTIKHA